MNLVLASNSPRRREILEELGYEFDVFAADFDESSVSLKDPAKAVQELALGKAMAAVYAFPMAAPEGTVFLGSDTVVVLDNDVLGKPKDEADAVRMLQNLSGKTHTVYTGVAAVTAQGEQLVHTETFVSATDVTFFELTEEEIADYVATGEPMDKAGAYGIQGKGRILVEGINGDYLTVVGLPAAKVYRLLKTQGVFPQVPKSKT